MNRNELLKELEQREVKLSVKNERLIIEAPKGVLTPELRNSLTEHKLDIMNLLGQTEINNTSLPVIKADLTRRYEPFPLTDIQQAHWLGRSQVFELSNVSNHHYLEFEASNLDLSRLSTALHKVISRHDMMRAVVLPTGEQQILEKVPPYEISILDLRGLENIEVDTKLQAVREKLSHQMLPPQEWPWFKIQATYLDEQRVRIHINMDLLVADAASIRILFQEWNQLYHNPEIYLSLPQISFRDYVINKQTLQNSELVKRSQNYWSSRLDSLPPAPELPLICFLRELKNSRFKRYKAQLEPHIWEQLKQKGKNAGFTPSVVLLTAFCEVLSMWSKNPRFTLNLTVLERLPLHPEINRVIGDFTDTTLLAVDNSSKETFTIRGQKIQQQLLQDLDHLYVGGVELLRELARRQKTDVAAATMPIVFSSVLGLNSFTKGDLEFNFLGELIYGISQTPQVLLDHQLTEQNGVLIFNWDVVEELFPEGLLDDMFGAYYNLLEGLATSESAWMEVQQQLLPATQLSQRHQINNTQAAICEKTLHGLFIDQVKAQPHKVAVITNECQLTYGKLYRKASALAQRLQQLGVTPNTLVAVVMGKGWEQVVGVLGILMSGGAYLPIDPSLPPQRQHYLLSQGQVKLVVTQCHLEPDISLPPGVQSLCVDNDNIETLNTTPIRHHENNSDLAYVIYTSGSTGLPKGVAINHRGAVNTIVDINQRFGVGNTDCVLAISALNFDLSVYDIFGMLAAGGTIVIPPQDAVKDPVCWYELIVKFGVTIWNTVPALMQMLTEYLSAQPAITPLPLRLALLSGDWLPLSLPGQIQNYFGDIQIISLGGATEASIWSICYPIETVNPNWKSIPYGKPLTNQYFQILNELMLPTPVWVPGQLYIGGIGLANGYWGDEEKTNASFITHPVTGEKLYKTGDLGRYLPDGNIEFLGRDDFQVKINGYRIELGEIEATLKQHPAIKEAIVIAVGESQNKQQLVAYIVSEEPSLSSTEFQLYLQEKLPKYMIPNAFMQLDILPLTPNGKVDRQALPKANLEPTQQELFIASRDTIELQLAQIWSDILNITPVGVTNNFFDLGGNSILAVRLINQIQKQFQKHLPLATLFQSPTISELAELLRSSADSIPCSSLVPIQLSGDELPLFCIHPLGGNILCYQDLARHLNSKRPIYGLQALGLNPLYEPHTQIEQMATHYIQELQTVQPHGPYFICGLSMGSLIALEMAQKISSQGEQIALLALLDPFTPSMMTSSISEEDLALLALGFLGNLNFNLEQLSQLQPDERLIYVVEEAKKNNLVPDDFDLDQVRHLLHISKLNYQAEQNYQPQYYSGKIILFKANETDADFETAWNELAPDVEMHVVPGNHYNMLQKPHVQTLAQQLQKYLHA